MASSVGITFGILLLITLFPRAQPYLAIQATTETLRYRVTRPAMAYIPVLAARPVGETLTHCGSPPKEHVNGRIDPSENAIVRYRIAPSDEGKLRVGVEIEAPGGGSAGRFTTGETQGCGLRTKATFDLGPSDETSFAGRPLPIAGPGEIGQETTDVSIPATGDTADRRLMIAGTVHVYGRTNMPFAGGQLYPAAGEGFVLPAGGRLSSGDDFGPVAPTGVAAWYGFARIEGSAFTVSATTVSDSLRLFRPGGHSEAETFSMGYLAGLLNDPSTALITLALVLLTASLGAVGGLMSLREPNGGDKK